MSTSVEVVKSYVTLPLSSTTEASATIARGGRFMNVDGWLRRVYIQAPSTSANVSGTLKLTDENGVTVWTFGTNGLSSGLASAHYLTAADVPVLGTYYFDYLLGGAPGSATGASATPLTATVTLWLEK